MKYLWILLLSIPLLGQEIQKDGQTPKTFTYAEALEMLKARDVEWKAKVKKLED